MGQVSSFPKKGNNGGEKKKNNNGGEGEKKGGDGIIAVVVKICVNVPNKLRVSAKVDLGKPRDTVETKGKKKVGGGGGGQNGDGKRQKKADKKPPVTTAVMKLDLHCSKRVEKIKKIIKDTKGYHGMSIDKQKNLITVKGTMNMKALADALKKKLNKPVDIVSPKKEGGGN